MWRKFLRTNDKDNLNLFHKYIEILIFKTIVDLLLDAQKELGFLSNFFDCIFWKKNKSPLYTYRWLFQLHTEHWKENQSCSQRKASVTVRERFMTKREIWMNAPKDAALVLFHMQPHLFALLCERVYLFSRVLFCLARAANEIVLCVFALGRIICKCVYMHAARTSAALFHHNCG